MRLLSFLHIGIKWRPAPHTETDEFELLTSQEEHEL